MKNQPLRRFFALLVMVAILAGLALPAAAVRSDSLVPYELERVDNSAVTAGRPTMGTISSGSTANPNELVRVSIQLEKAPTIDAGFSLMGIGSNSSAMTYREGLLADQKVMATRIQRQVLGGQELDVVWNLTLAANIISANVPRCAIDQIKAMDGIKAVVEEKQYSPDVASVGGAFSPNMAVSTQMTGASQVWLDGLTGAGSRVAIIDTGLDTDHQSFDPEAFDYAIAEVENEKGISYDLLDPEEIDTVLTQLNAYKRLEEAGVTLTAEELYINSKAAYGFNYVDGDLDVTHDNDGQGEHGSHVAGIAIANRYLKKDGQFVSALEEVYVAGDAPDAQVLVMKVFGKDGGAFDSDIMVSIEDAMLLGADSVNLSLGSASVGTAAMNDPTYEAIMARVVESGMVVVASAGNDGQWADYSTNGYLYNDGVNYDTVGSPGSYDNFLAVASVDNDGLISSSLVVGETAMGYSESLTDNYGYAFGNAAIATLDTTEDGSGTEYDFVLVEDYGDASSYDGIDVAGKVVLASRGGDVYYYEKANAAAEAGAVALIVYNNAPGTILMDLSGYNYNIPVVIISQRNGGIVKAAGQAQLTADGRTCYTGKITIRGRLAGNYENSEFKTMSSFSSWGVPGDLSLKPEITAPGGNIYSVNGAVPETDQYELMSGTSMSAPQISGLVALVKQYLEEQGYQSELNARALTQSLLMSTAEPMLEGTSGSYYSVFQQGSGLANVVKAVSTPVYMTVAGMEDGVVKVELGDDPDREGIYTFAFSLHNLTDQAISYQLDADAFTQAVFFDAEGHGYLDTLTRAMDADTEFVVDGVSLSAPNADNANFDFNGDGRVTRADGQLLLDKATCGAELAANENHADINGDGKVDTYDVHMFLKQYQSAVEVPANGTVTVEVTMTLSDAEKALLAAQNPVGAYVEAFVKATPVIAEGGELLPVLSIPVLGYYGNWTEASMFDVGTQVTFANGQETRSSYLNNTYGNAIGVIHGDDDWSVWYFGGNPLVPDEEYIPERNAINTARGDYFYQWSFAPIRGAAASRVTVENTTTGEVLLDYEGGPISPAFYYYAYQSWMDTPQYLDIAVAPDMEAGEYGKVTLTLAPEYYLEDGEMNWDALGAGATMEFPFTIDNEYPEILDVTVDTERNVMLVTASDNQYLAGVQLYDVTGRYLLSKAGTTAEAQPGETITFEVPLEGVDGYKFIIQTSDYASNLATYEIRQTIGEPAPLPTRLAFDENFNSWSTFYSAGYYWNTERWFDSEVVVNSATAVGEYALACDIGGGLYVIPVEDMMDEVFVRKLPYVLDDMAYDASTDTVYGITSKGLLVSIDKYTGQTQELGTVGVDTNTLANDGKGTFYCIAVAEVGSGYYVDYRLDLYSFTLDTIEAPTLVGSPYTGYSKPEGVGTLEYDPYNNILSLFTPIPSYSYSYSYYYEIDPITATSLIDGYYPPMPFTKAAVGLIFPQWGEEHGAWVAPTDQVSEVALAKDHVDVLLNLTAQLTTTVLPWNLNNKNVVYTSADESIATVNASGVVTGVGLGTTTIRATSVVNPAVYDECTVTVDTLNVTVDGILVDEAGAARFFSWDQSRDEGYTRLEEISERPMALTRVPETDTFYLLNSDNGTMHLMDDQGNDLAEPSDYYYRYNYWIWDLAYSEVYSTEDAPQLFGIRENSIIAPFDPMNPDFVTFTMGSYGVSFLAGIASGGYEYLTYKDYYGNDTETDSELVYVIDDKGNVWRCNLFLEWGYYPDMVYSVITSDLDINFPAGFSGRSSLVVGEDGALYFSAWTGNTNELYRLVYDDVTETYQSTLLGSFGKDVWPAQILDVTSNAPRAAQPPQGVMRYRDSAPQGGLDAIVAEPQLPQTPGSITVDETAQTVTVPVLVEDSTNGLFAVEYDENILTLQSVNAGNVMNSVLTEPGKVTMGYADAGIWNGTVANLVFSYTATDAIVHTELTVTALEDGEVAEATAETLALLLPGQELADEEFEQCFDDVNQGHWFYDEVKYTYENGLMNGVAYKLFAPGAEMDRAMLATVLYRLAGEPAYTMDNPYQDVAEGAYYYDAVLWCTENGVFKGYPDGIFAPTTNLTREQVATVLYRYTGEHLGLDTAATAELTFTDADDVADWAEEGMVWAVAAGLLQGYPDGTVCPNAPATRAEIAAIMMRYCQTILSL